MNKKELFKQCRYYDGNETFKGDYKNLRFWEAEKLYIEQYGTQTSATSVKFYLECGLAGTNYDLPIELLACLFEIYCNGSDTPPEILAISFKGNFLSNYLARPL